MRKIEYRTVDKSGWQPGPWQDEPDKIQWQDEATALPCLIVRNTAGALCGYVGVLSGHPAYGKHYRELEVGVHGGLTYASRCQLGSEDKAICHKPDRGEPDDIWWLGFDCAHWNDFAPHPLYDYCDYKENVGAYRDRAYVEAQVRELAQQLVQMATKCATG